MSKSRQVLRHPLEHPAEALCTVAICAAGQLLMGWALAKAADRAERDDLLPVL